VRAGRWGAALALALLSCRGGVPKGEPVLAQAAAPRAPEVRYRPGTPPPGPDAQLVALLPTARYDAGLDRAADEIIGRIARPDAHLDPRVTSRVLAQVGYPAQARLLTLVNAGAFPEVLVDDLMNLGDGDPLDVAIAQRCWGDGQCLWLVAAGVGRASLDPLPRDLPIDGTLGLRVDTDRVGALRLFLAPPDGPVEEMNLASGTTRWVDRFHAPGEHRLEVVADHRGVAQVLLLFSVFVDAAPPEPGRMVGGLPAPHPAEAEDALYERLNALRRARGLPAVRRFALFESPAREHSALMAAEGRVAHKVAGQSGGVPEAATNLALPRARFHENVAAAYSAVEAAHLVEDSPGHLRNLLCPTCTHASIGVALEPALGRQPRLFVTWELLEFPEGEPQRIMR
jgi:hypothetical protein